MPATICSSRAKRSQSSRPDASERQVACQCGHPLVGKQAPAALVSRLCQACEHPTGYRTWVWHCTMCDSVMCKECRAVQAKRRWADPVAPSAGRAVRAATASKDSDVLPDAVQDGDKEVLLRLLRTLPKAYPAPAALWAPRAVQEQVSVVLRQLLAAAARQAGAPQGDVDAECAHLLLLHAPQILLRPNPVLDAQVQGERLSFADRIRGRLRRLCAGQWCDLVRELQQELDDRLPKPGRTGPPDSAELPVQVAQAVSTRARAGALKSAAAMLLEKTQVEPGRKTDEALQALFLTGERAAADQYAFDTCIAQGKALPAQQRLQITYRHVARQLRATRPGAGPGPSGWRNSHVLLLSRDPHGSDALLQWSHVWATGAISPWLARLWTGSLARPFFKDEPDCNKIRPVLCSEALYKHAFGTIVRALEGRVQRACGPSQFAVSRAHGAAQQIAQVRAAASAFPTRVLLSLDVKNAFGAVPWHVAMDATLALVPALAPALAAAWAPGAASVFTQTQDGGWSSFDITGSLVQGNPEGSPVYCLVAAAVLQRARGALARNPKVKMPREWSYVDDVTLQMDPESAPAVVDAVKASYGCSGLSLQEAKCSFHLPSHRGCSAADLPQSVDAIRGRVAYAPHGLVLLGSVAAGDFAQPLYQGSDAPEQLKQRCAKAIRLAGRLEQLIQAAPPAGGKQPAFALVRHVVAHALDFDCSVLPCCLVQPYAEQLDESVCRVVAACMDMPRSGLSGDVLEQVWLPRRLGGLQVSCSRRQCPLARAATIMGLGPAIRDCIVAWQEVEKCDPPLDPHAYDAVFAEGDALVKELTAQGIVGLNGRGCPQDGLELHADALRVLQPADHLLSKLLAAAADRAHDSLIARLTSPDQSRLRSAGGASAGSSLIAPLSYEGVHFADWQLTLTLQARLGINQELSGERQLCANRRRDETVCGAPLDEYRCHALDCPIGPLRNQRHDNLADEYATILEECGAIARREAYVHEMSDHREAWLDVWALGVPELPDLLLDITVRNPVADRYRAGAARADGAAAAEAEEEKAKRYPAAGGRAVWPVAYEVFGRAGDQAEHLLGFLAAVARRRAYRRGRSAGQELQRWRARIDAALQKAVAAQLLAARVGLPGRRLVRRRPVDLTAIEAAAQA